MGHNKGREPKGAGTMEKQTRKANFTTWTKPETERMEFRALALESGRTELECLCFGCKEVKTIEDLAKFWAKYFSGYTLEQILNPEQQDMWAQGFCMFDDDLGEWVWFHEAHGVRLRGSDFSLAVWKDMGNGDSVKVDFHGPFTAIHFATDLCLERSSEDDEPENTPEPEGTPQCVVDVASAWRGSAMKAAQAEIDEESETGEKAAFTLKFWGERIWIDFNHESGVWTIGDNYEKCRYLSHNTKTGDWSWSVPYGDYENQIEGGTAEALACAEIMWTG